MTSTALTSFAPLGQPSASIRQPLYGPVAADELLHGVAPVHGYQATETSYFGFNIPEQSINGEIYVWLHPQLRVCSAGVFIWRGLKGSTLEADYSNYQNYLPFPVGDLNDYSLPIGLKVQVDVPLERVRIRFEDLAADTSFELVQQGVCAPIGRPGGGHFTQPMKVDGRLRLNGEDWPVDGWFSRDRSWLEERSEERRAIPPRTWMVGVFGQDLAFHTSAFDDPAGADWAEAFPDLQAVDRFRWGYLLEDGAVIQLTDCVNKRTRREVDGVTPAGFAMDLVAANGRIYHVDGEVKARLPFNIWPNMVTYFCLVEWRLDGRQGWGDAQDIQYNAFVRDSVRR